MYCHAIKMNRSRICWPSGINNKANMSTNSNSKNHYDTLEVKQSATHDEIKSAYYKLTMQYHPDKNKCDSAKEKFRHVTEAYEVLGKESSRNKYDRKITVNKTRLSPQKRGPIIVKPPTMNIYKTRMATDTENIDMDHKIYNYEQWVRNQHRINFKQCEQAYARLKCMVNEEKEQNSPLLVISLTIFSIIILLFYIQTTNYYDVPVEKTKSSIKNTKN